MINLTVANSIKVRNMTSPRTQSKVANQFVIDTNEGQYFQSYETVIAFYENKTGIFYLDNDSWDYSVTTLKYLKQFLGSSYTKKEIQKMIDDGIYNTADLN